MNKSLNVRSHHLRFLLGLESALDPKNEHFVHENGNRLRTLARRNINKILQYESYSDSGREWDDSRYKNDVLGEKLDHTGFERVLMQFYTNYTSLPEETCVDMYSNKKDLLCSGCAVGDHCKSVMSEDRYLKSFVRVAKIINCQNDVTIVSEQENEMHVTTTLGTLRKVVRYVLQHTKKPHSIDPTDDNGLSTVWIHS